ncbi:MAG: type II CAAX endopeptidase family protein [Cyanobacteria bacterium P01_D01_bin.36]
MDRPDSLPNSPPGLPAASLNPFFKLKSRYLILGTYIIASLAVGLAYGSLGQFGLLPWAFEDPISRPILDISIWIVLVSVVVLAGKEEGLKFKRIFGPNWANISPLHAGLLVLSLLLFSMGSFSVVFYIISSGFPELATQMLRTDLMVGANNSEYPQLYDALLFFWPVIFAPLVEEFVFRGFLLQRWGATWGLRWGIIASSILFGGLHFNNPVGLTLFGFVMALLYVKTRSLWVPVACHSLNNLIVVGISLLSHAADSDYVEPATVEAVRQNWGWGLVLMLISAPMLWRFVRHSWPQVDSKIPYLVNGEKT